MQDYLQIAVDVPLPARDAMYRLIDEVKRLANRLAKVQGLPELPYPPNS
jgi:hypothetical protein